MTRLALPGKCGAFGARGLMSPRVSSASNCERIPGKSNEPLTSERIISRREQPQLAIVGLVHIYKLIAAKQDSAVACQGSSALLIERKTSLLHGFAAAAQIFLAGLNVFSRCRTPKHQFVSVIDSFTLLLISQTDAHRQLIG